MANSFSFNGTSSQISCSPGTATIDSGPGSFGVIADCTNDAIFQHLMTGYTAASGEAFTVKKRSDTDQLFFQNAAGH